MICVLATIEVKANRRKEFLGIFRQLVPQVQAEQGCIEYGPMVDLPTHIRAQVPPRENVVVVVEKWESVEALETHLMAPHMIQYRKDVEDIVVGVEIQILQPA